MKPKQINYPIFEVNQVLTNEHLNNAFDYLDEQERLTRANLIGIGIFCGFETQLNGTTIRLNRGGGITSEGYLIIETEDLDLISYRKLDKNLLDYDSFKMLKGDLYEIFSKEESDTTTLTLDNERLKNKVVVLYLELEQANLRNCSPNNCNDKGTEVTPRVRRLLINKEDLDAINKELANKLRTDLTFGDTKSSIIKQLKLPDLHLPRYDVPSTNPVTSNQVLQAFYTVLKSDNLVQNTKNALVLAYKAFEPLIRRTYAKNPFEDSTFTDKFDFLNRSPTTENQVRFLQYYYDFFDDLFRAYDEFRWKGMELMCACCPHEDLFPRHLMLAELPPAPLSNQNVYRHYFMASSAVSGCEDRAKELLQLFQRIVEMITQFTDSPSLIDTDDTEIPDKQIRITPSKFGNVLLSDKSIPYYYTKNNEPKLFEYWSVEKTRRQRSKQNLSYHAKYYPSPTDNFVVDPLRYDLENYNFLRIEGHLGKRYDSVIKTLLSLKEHNRLSFEIIALSTGTMDSNMVNELTSNKDCHFQDLRAMCEVMRRELRCLIQKAIAFLSSKNVEREVAQHVKEEAAIKATPKITQFIPNFSVLPGTFGYVYLTQYSDQEVNKFFDIADQQPIIKAASYTVELLMAFAEVLEKNFCDHDWDVFEKQYQNLKNWNNEIFKQGKELTSRGDLSGNDLSSQLDSVIYHCKLEAIKAINEEYQRRAREIVRKHTLSGFLEDHPGIQHKAGVPLGGTFIVVYHSDSKIEDTEGIKNEERLKALLRDFSKDLPNDPEKQKVYLNEFITAQNRQFSSATIKNDLKVNRGVNGSIDDKIAEVVNSFTNGYVIADFYLPYLCCSDCTPVQFVLPRIPPTVTVQIKCTDSTNKKAIVIVNPKGGVAPYYYKLDDSLSFHELPDELSLNVGNYELVIKDSAGDTSPPQNLSIPEPLSIEVENYIDDKENVTYQVSFPIKGGTPPYTADPAGKIEFREGNHSYTSVPIRSGKSLTVKITDKMGCLKESKKFDHTVCTLPCNNGQAIRCGYIFWLPKPNAERKLQAYQHEIIKCEFVTDKKTPIDIIKTKKLSFKATGSDLERINVSFEDEVGKWVKKINDAFNDALSKEVKNKAWFKLAYHNQNNGKRDALIIEHFECENFNEFTIEIKTSFTYNDLAEERTVVYRQNGALMTINDFNELLIQSFDCEEKEKCLPNQDWTPRCEEGKIDFEAVSKNNSENSVQLIARSTGSEVPSQYLWEVEDASPSVLVGKEVETQIVRLSPGIKKVRVTAFSEKGCAVTKESTIAVNQPIG